MSRSKLKLASFDGGGARGLSQLEIMGAIMYRLQCDRYPNDPDRIILPCEHFDLIGGTGTGGLIAIMLAKLGMSVDEASEEFFALVQQVYAPKDLEPAKRAQKLRECMEGLLKKKGLPVDLKLRGETPAGQCAGFIVASHGASVTSKTVLRTYLVRSQLPSPITVVDAALASCSVQPDFAPISSGSGYKKKVYIAAGLGANNPVCDVITEAHELFSGDSTVSFLLSLGTGHPGTIPIPPEGTVDIHQLMRDMMNDCERRAQEFERRLGRVGIYFRFSVQQGMQNIHGGQATDPSWIASQTEAYLLDQWTSDNIDALLRTSNAPKKHVTLGQLEYVGGTGVSEESTATLETVLDAIELNQDGDLLADLKLADLECGPHAGECLEGTRLDLLKRIKEWTTDFSAPNILWLKGHPGVGKSAIATSMVEHLSATKRLGSRFFFQRQKANLMTSNALWRTVAYDLARIHPTIRKAIVTRLKEGDLSLTTVNVDKLFLQLIREPLVENENNLEELLPVVIIDALDECGGLEGQYSGDRKALLRTFTTWSDLPPKFKLIVTSRAESDIERLFSATRHFPIKISAGQTVEARSSEDIRLFLAHRLREVTVQYQESLPSDWPGAQTVNQLAFQAAGLFIWAETVVKFIVLGHAKRRLKQVLEGGGTGNMGTLYQQILSHSFREPTKEDSDDFRSVVGAIILSKAPLSPSSLMQLLSIDKFTVEYICNGLQSVLESKDILQFHHQSFVDFLLDQSQCPPTFGVNRKWENRKLTLACLQVLKNNLRFNICGLESSHSLNVDVPELLSREKEHIPPHLSYSCCWWASHLVDTEFDDKIFRDLQYFMQKQFLFWLEVLSIIKRVYTGSRALSLLINWIPAHCQDDALAMARDMQRFLAAFARVISQSAPHIYLSALPFAPQNSAVSKQYRHDYPKTLTIETGGLRDWPAVQHILRGHSSGVNCVAYSRDGHHIVSSSYDETIRVWDAETGEVVAGPFDGHSDWVNSVAFSPDGCRIVSGSEDKTIRIWDVETGEMVVGPLEGHSSRVLSVAFSPDGHRLVSGSGDRMVRIWDAETGEVVVGPMKGHSDYVRSVAFSPDGHKIVSGSRDNTIRIWDAETGDVVVGPLEGHLEMVTSVAFSPDGHRIVSGSHDNTIRIWDVETGEVVVGPLEGHGDTVWSVAFSPDGHRLVSGSEDNTIRIWDAETGEEVVGTLEGHISIVCSVAFSPDGLRVVSGSDDGTIRVWDAEIGKVAVEPLEGHSDVVTSVAFSPDGHRIMSGSGDWTIWVWDAETGEVVVGPLEGHSDYVNSVAFSPDGHRIVSGSNDRTIRVWDAERGKVAVKLLEGHTSMVMSVAFSPEGHRIVSGSYDSTIRVWDAETGKMVVGPLEGHSGCVNSVAFSPDGHRIVSGSYDETIRIWDAETGQVVAGPMKGHTGWVRSVAFSPDGRQIVSGSDDRTIKIWDADAGEVVVGPVKGHSSTVCSVAFSPDGHRIVSGSGDKTIRIWDAETGEVVVGPMNGHRNTVWSVAFSPDGHRLVSGSADETILVWNAETGEVMADPFEGHSDSATSVAFSPDGHRIVSSAGDETIRVWHIERDGSKAFNKISTAFTDTSVMKDGWMLGSNSEPLFWIPPALQVGLLRPSNIIMIGKSIATRLDLKSFVHGESWALCKESASLSILDA